MKFFLKGLLVLSVAACCFACRTETVEKRVVVETYSGATMWGICSRLASEYGDRRDIREIIYYSREASNLDQLCHLAPGQKVTVVLKVPKR